VVGVLWAAASQGVTSKELRGAIGLPRERLETAYEFLLEHPPLGLAVRRHGEEFSLVTAPEVSSSIERRLGNPCAVLLCCPEQLWKCWPSSPTATLLDRKLIERNPHQLLATTRVFLDHAGLRDLADRPYITGVAIKHGRWHAGRRLKLVSLTDEFRGSASS
jgi:chromosome segregation and condensation protein ScpB